MDCDAIYRHTGAQASLCHRLRAAAETRTQALLAVCVSLGLPPSLDAHRAAAHLDAPTGELVRKLLTELAQAERDVWRLNEEQAVLINGSRRTLRVLGNAFASFSTIYKPPLYSQAFVESRMQP